MREGLRYWAAVTTWVLATCLAAGADSPRRPTSGPAPADGPPKSPALVVQVSPQVCLSEMAIRLALGLDKSYTVVVADTTPLTQEADFLLQITLKSVRFTNDSTRARGMTDNDGKKEQKSWKDAAVYLNYVASARPKPGVRREQVAKGEARGSASPLEWKGYKGYKEGESPSNIITWTFPGSTGAAVDQDGKPVMNQYILRNWTPDQVRFLASVESIVEIQRGVRFAILKTRTQGKPVFWSSTVFDPTAAEKGSPDENYIAGQKIADATKKIAVAVMLLDALASPSPRPATAPATPGTTPKATAAATAEDRAAAKVRLAQNYLTVENISAARKILQEVVTDFPSTSAAEKARKELKDLPASDTPPAGK
jgi:hypothetical protein